MKGKKILSAFIALMLIAGMPVAAFAETWYIENGNITITADGSGQNVSQGGGEAIADSDPVISGTSDSNTITIIADAGATANVTLDGVNIDVSNTGATGVPGKAGISTKGDGNVTIELEGDNTVKSGNFRAGVEKNNGGNLTIKDDSGKDGSLAATGGEYCAGIGGSDSKDGNNITISGGTINATGGIHGAGIGGGNGGNGNNITISGGTVNATGNNGAGIGGGESSSGVGGNGSNITISGGNVTASSGGWYGAGIGGGSGGNGSDITISDGTVDSTGGKYAAGIGGGQEGNGSDIRISGGNVTATGGEDAAGIGGGDRRDGTGGNGSNITISGGDVTAKGGRFGGAGIGGGEGGNGSDITVSGGTTDAEGGIAGAGIGGGSGGSGSDIKISNGKVTAKGGDQAAGIGGGASGDGSNIKISGGDINATGSDGGAGIGGGWSGSSGSDIGISGGNVTAVGSDGGAGIGGGAKGSGSEITISGNAQVKVKGGEKGYYNGAGSGIGSGGSRDNDDYSKYYDGDEIPPDTSKLTEKGKIEYYEPGSDIDGTPTKTTTGSYVPQEPKPEQSAKATDKAATAPGESAPLYRVTDKDGKDLAYKYEKNNGVLTVTVEAEYAVLTGSLAGINALSQQGIEELVFITNGATSTYKLAELLDMGSLSDGYALTHDGKTATFDIL